MNRSDLIKALVVILVLFFVLEPIAIGMIGNSSGSPKTKIQQTSDSFNGISYFNATVKSYEPYLIIQDANPPVDLLKKLPEVDDLVKIEGGYAVSLKDTSTLRKVYLEIARLGLKPYPVVNLQLPSLVEVTDGTINKTLSTNSQNIKLNADPFFDENQQVELRMSVTSENGAVVAYSNPSFVEKAINLNLTAKVDSFSYYFQRYSIPWEIRNTIDVTHLKSLFGESNVTYTQKDFISSKFIGNESFEYITKVEPDKVFISSNFTSKSDAIADLGEEIVFPDSILDINSPQGYELSSGILNTSKFIYELTLSEDESYFIANPYVEMALDSKFQPNETITLELDGKSVGKGITAINNLKFVK